MVVGKDTTRLVKKHDLINLAILLVIALGIGVYLVLSTVLVAHDSVIYIERARRLSSDPFGIIKQHPVGYPFLIFMAYKIFTVFGSSSSVYTWIYSAQSVSLMCRLLALIPLYFIGKLLIGSRKSFWAILILVVLPYPARFGSDVLKDWPHILFLASGFLLLLWGAKRGQWWMFAVAGLAAGLGHIIRPECAQLVIYGALWLLIRLFLPKPNMNRPKLICALLFLLIGFAIPAVPYMKAGGRILPGKVRGLISSSCRPQSDRTQDRNIDSHNHVYAASSLPGGIAKAIGRLIVEISDNLMYFFVPALVIGIYSRFRKQSVVTDIERFFVPAFVTLNVIMLVPLHYHYGYISRRHSLPLVVITIFYVPIGLQVLGNWLGSRFSRDRLQANQNLQLWFLVLFIVGLAICIPKLLRPMRIEKKAYRLAA